MIDSAPWVTRSHPGPRAKPLAISATERAELEGLLRLGTVQRRISQRAQALLLMADGVGFEDIARLLGVHSRTVTKWRTRFRDADKPLAKLADAPRSGRPLSLSRRQMQ